MNQIRNRALVTLAAALVGVAAALPVQLRADDTEVYVGNRAFSEGVRPNIMLILDTSGSMGSTDGEDLDRLDRVKLALDAILNQTHDVNLGLMRFSVPGGPVLFPIAPIDSDAADVEVGLIPEVDARVQGGANDVEENDATGEVLLDSNHLEMTRRTSFGAETSFVASITSSSDDGDENTNDTALDLNDDSLNCCTKIGGLRFTGVNIPNAAPVLSAHVEFISDTTQDGAATLTFSGHAHDNAPTFVNGAEDIHARAQPGAATAATVTWSGMPGWVEDERYRSPNLAAIVQEIVDRPGWVSGNALAITFQGSGNRRIRSFDDSNSPLSAASLFITYGTADPGGLPQTQTIGLRFENVRIPQGQGIQSAVIEFVPAADADPANPVNLMIEGELVADSAPFEATPNNVSARTWSIASVPWNPPAATWSDGVAVQSPDLTSIVQTMVNQSDWCGGNAMSFRVRGPAVPGPFTALSFEGDAGRAPVLRIDFDATSPPGPGKGCITQQITRRISSDADDANQEIDDPSPLSTAATKMRMNEDEANGLVFRDIPIPLDAEIVDARLELTVLEDGTPPLDIDIQGQLVDTATEFTAAAGTDVISRRPLTDAVTWRPADWPADSVQVSPNIAPIINAIVNDGTDWASGNDLALVLRSSGSGSLTAESHFNAARAPLLRITTKVKLGDMPGATVTTVRDRLKQIVAGLDHGGYTPLVDILYEAALYFRGDDVKWGLTRGTDDASVKRSTRVSHPASYTGGTVVRAAGCTDANLNARACESERIDPPATYISPINTQCQANFIVLLTDGEATRNSSRALVRDLTDISSCRDKLLPREGVDDDDIEDVKSNEECGLDLVTFLNDVNNDQAPDVPGPNTVTTYTIGLEISNQWLKDVAKAGGGEFFEAGTTESLVRTFNEIVAKVIENSTSFATPSLSVNSFNRLFHLENVYFSLFQPGRQVAWDGNVKKYRVCESDTPGTCEVAEIVDARDPPLLAIDEDGRILENALSFWSGSADGANVLEGGAAAQIPDPDARRVFTYTDTVEEPSLTPLAGADSEHVLIDSDGDGVLDGLTGGTADERLQQTKDLLGWPGAAVATLSSDEKDTLRAELNEHIRWIRGEDVDDEDDDVTTTVRHRFADALHSSAVAVTFGGDTETHVVKVFVGTNDGAIRAINGVTGVEEFIFYPPSLLPQLVELRRNFDGTHRYGIDGSATIWLNDVDNDGVIARGDGDFARLFIGMRRGGNQIFALDVTPIPDEGLTAADVERVDAIDPVYMWRIQGSTEDYPRLGQTWSRPLLTSVAFGNVPSAGLTSPVTVLLFAGGYSENQDAGFGPGGLGNAIYMANPLTGERLMSISPEDPGSGDGVEVPAEMGMDFPIPSNLALIDANGNGTADRIYVGDTGGQVWRVDLAPNDPADTTEPGLTAVVGKLATVSSQDTLADQRKLFEPPDVVRVRGNIGGVSGVPNYDLVTIVSGNRAHPLELNTLDRFFAFRDAVIGPMTDEVAPFGIADDFVPIQGPLDSPPTDGDLFDVTPIAEVEGDDLTALQGGQGYYLDLLDPGEKGLSSPIILEGRVFFTTYLPQAVVNEDACSLVEGGGRLYGFDVLSGTAVINWDGSPDSDPLSVADRSLALGSGIPSSAVPIFQPEKISLLIGGGGGATVVDPGLQLLRRRTYWFEQE